MQWLLVIFELCFHGHHGNVSKILVNNRSFRHANLSTETKLCICAKGHDKKAPIHVHEHKLLE